MAWPISRRTFLASAALVTAGICPRIAQAIDPFPRIRPSHLKLSLAAYSYKPYLTGEKSPKMDLFQFVDLAAELAVDAVELTSYYFPDIVNADYLHRLKQHAFVLGLDVSGTSVMNDFCLPPGPETEREIGHVKTWIDNAAELGAPFVRILSGNWIQGTPDEELEERVIQRIGQLLPYAEKRGVMLALENHGGGVTTTPENLLRIVKAIKGPAFGVNLDTGNFHGGDPYAEVAQLVPYSVNVQVKTEIRRKGRSKEDADLRKVVAMLRQARYSGYVVLEYNAPEDPMMAVPRYLKQLRTLIA
ncbi:MAG: sugar phosphate isomerase/epimerase [Planctomycetia bacterium]|nr:sugar phosphate isomerase/epimerase [Planctomycetia bacterium]